MSTMQAAGVEAATSLGMAHDKASAAAQALSRRSPDMPILMADLASAKADVGVLKTDVASLRADVITLRTDVTTLKTDTATMKVDMAVLKWSTAVIIAALPSLVLKAFVH